LRAFDAGVEVDERPPGARAPLLVDRVAGADLHRLDDDALAHLRPAWLGVLLVLDLAALASLDGPDLDLAIDRPDRLHARLVVGPLAHDIQHRVEREDAG